MSGDKSRRIRDTAVGWLEIEITGAHAERLLNLALQQGVELHHIRHYGDTKITARVLLRDIYVLRSLARAARCRFRIKKRRGLPFLLAKARRRTSFLLGGLAFALVLWLICSVIWTVDVASPYVVDAEDRAHIIALAEQAGLKRGSLSWLLDFDTIQEQILLSASDELIFVQIERRGVTATVNVVWRIDLEEEDKTLAPGEIIATADGIIESLLVRNGTPAVAVGDTFKEGDVLVYGYSGERLVAASAIIEATVWGYGTADWPLQETGTRATGQTRQGLLLRFGQDGAGSAVWLGRETASPYPLFTLSEQVFTPVLWRNIQVPVELVLHTWYEQHEYATSYTETEALYHAGQAARAEAVEALPSFCDIQNESRQEAVMDGVARVRVTLEALAEVGEYQALDEARLQQYQQLLALMQQQAREEEQASE